MQLRVPRINGMNVIGYRSWVDCVLWGEPGNFRTALVLVLAGGQNRLSM